jgi:hypothetical protein
LLVEQRTKATKSELLVASCTLRPDPTLKLMKPTDMINDPA